MVPHVVAGLTSDANILINQARLAAQRYYYSYQEPIPVEQLVRSVCDYKQAYTQFGGTLWQSAVETWGKRHITTLNMSPFMLSAYPYRSAAVRCVVPLRRLGPTPWLPAL